MTNRNSSQDSTVPGQSYLSSSISGVLQGSNCRRGVMAMGGEGDVGLVTPTNSDVCLRYGFTFPVTPYRFRLRVRNSNLKANTTNTGSVTFVGVAVGPANKAENSWAGDFTTTPTSLGISGSQQIGSSEYVSPWITPATFGLQSGTFYGLSIGLTCSGVQLNSSDTPGWVFQGTGASAAWQSQAAPSGGAITAAPYLQYLDVRMDFEYVGSNEIGIFLGDSITNGWLQTLTTAVAAGHMGPDNTWPHIAGLRLGHNDMNGGIGQATSGTWAGTVASSLCWTRFFSPESSNTAFACTPDYAVICVATNDAVDAGSNPLSTFQTNIQTIVASLNALGITRIYMQTGTPGFTVQVGTLPSFQAGQIMASVSSTQSTVAIATEAGLSYAGGQVGTSATNVTTAITMPMAETGQFTAGDTIVVTGAAGGTWSVINGTWTITTVTGAHIIFSVTTAPTGTYTANSATVFGVFPFGLFKGGPGNSGGQPGASNAWYQSTGGPFNFFLGTPQAPVGGPYVVSGVVSFPAVGDAMVLSTSTTLTTAPAGTPIMTASEYYRQLINQFIRSLPPGIQGIIDLAADVGSQFYYPDAVGRPEYYSNSGDAHPTTVAMYTRAAQLFIQGITGN